LSSRASADSLARLAASSALACAQPGAEPACSGITSVFVKAKGNSAANRSTRRREGIDPKASVSTCASGDWQREKSGREIERMEVTQSLSGSETERFTLKRSQLVWEVRRVADSFCLQEMTAFVAYNDLESCSHRESKPRYKRIPKANAVYVLGARAEDEFTASSVDRKESIENRKANMRRGPDLGRSGSTLGGGRGLGKAANKPAREASGNNLLHRRIRLLFQGGGNRRHIGFVHDAEVFKALSHAPGTRRRLPIELFLGEVGNHRLRGQVICA